MENRGSFKWLAVAGLVLILIMIMAFVTGYALASWRPAQWADRLFGSRVDAQAAAPCPMWGAGSTCGAQGAAEPSGIQTPGAAAPQVPPAQEAPEAPEGLFSCH